MTIKEINGNRVLVEMGDMVIWLDKEMLRQYGIKTKGLKVGMIFNPQDYAPKNI
jgi:hypothetical protein